MWNGAILLNWVQKLWNQFWNLFFFFLPENSKMKVIVWLVWQQWYIVHRPNTLTTSINSRRWFNKSWDNHFYDHLEIVILSVDLHWLLKNIQCTQKVKPSNAPSPSQKCTRILENDKTHFQRIRGELFWWKHFGLGEVLNRATSNRKVGFVIHYWKCLFKTMNLI